jgi:hypothetical protein
MSKPQPPNGRVSPDYPRYPSDVLFPIPRWTERVHVSIASPFARPSPCRGRVGVHIFTFEACSDFTCVTARRIARPPKAAFVTRLRPGRSPSQAARQLPDQSTTLWVEPSSTGNARRRGAPLRQGKNQRTSRISADSGRNGAEKPNDSVQFRQYSLRGRTGTLFGPSGNSSSLFGSMQGYLAP